MILNHVRNGGSLISLCETWGVRYSDFIGWVRADKQRSDLYNEAQKDRSEWTDEMILSELRLTARFDMRKLYDEHGTRKRVNELDAETARMVQEVKSDGSLKLYDKQRAQELLGKHRRLFVDKTEHDISEKLEDILSKSYEQPAPPAAEQPPAAGPIA